MGVCAWQQAGDNEEIQVESPEHRSSELSGTGVEMTDLLRREEKRRGEERREEERIKDIL